MGIKQIRVQGFNLLFDAQNVILLLLIVRNNPLSQQESKTLKSRHPLTMLAVRFC